MTPDPSLLSDGERRVLALLAEGHTAKTIATETGLSVNAVNERLREARRKTGVGSSRELARLLRLQENRDEKIEVSEASSGSEWARDEDAPRRAGGQTRKGPIVMGFIIIAAAAGLALLAGEPQSPDDRKVPVEPRLKDVIPGSGINAEALYRRLRSEGRDEPWAVEREARLRALYAPLPRISDLRVRCATALCEVVGDIPAGVNDRTLIEAQRVGLRPDAVPGLRNVMFSVAAGPTRPGGTFVTYFERADARRSLSGG